MTVVRIPTLEFQKDEAELNVRKMNINLEVKNAGEKMENANLSDRVSEGICCVTKSHFAEHCFQVWKNCPVQM